MKFDFRDLNSKIPGFNDLVEEKALHLTQKITIDVHAEVVRGSPVDTGAFRAAWSAQTPTKAFEEGRVENPSSYGPPLARGHSKQAPDGWIDNAIEAATRLGGAS